MVQNTGASDLHVNLCDSTFQTVCWCLLEWNLMKGSHVYLCYSASLPLSPRPTYNRGFTGEGGRNHELYAWQNSYGLLPREKTSRCHKWPPFALSRWCQSVAANIYLSKRGGEPVDWPMCWTAFKEIQLFYLLKLVTNDWENILTWENDDLFPYIS